MGLRSARPRSTSSWGHFIKTRASGIFVGGHRSELAKGRGTTRQATITGAVAEAFWKLYEKRAHTFVDVFG